MGNHRNRKVKPRDGGKEWTAQEQINRLFAKTLRRQNGTMKRLKKMARLRKRAEETGCKPVL